MDAEISKSMFAPSRLVFFAGEQGGENPTQKPESVEAKAEAREVRKFQEKFEGTEENLLNESSVDKVYKKARDDLNKRVARLMDYINKNPSLFAETETKKGWENYQKEQLKVLENLKDKYSAIAKKNKEEFEKNKEDSAQKITETVSSSKKVDAVEVRVSLGEKKKAEVKDLSAELFPEEKGAEMAEKGEEKPAEKKDKLTDEQRLSVNIARAVNVELNKLMIKYEEKYGDSPKWKDFEESVMKDVEARTDLVNNFEKNPDASKINVAQDIGGKTPTEWAEEIINTYAGTNVPQTEVALKEEEQKKGEEGPKPEKKPAGFQTITAKELPEIKTPEVKGGKKEEIAVKVEGEEKPVSSNIDLSKINDTYFAEINLGLNPASNRTRAENQMKVLLLKDIAKAAGDEKPQNDVGLELFGGFEDKVYAEFKDDGTVLKIDEPTKKALVDRYMKWTRKSS